MKVVIVCVLAVATLAASAPAVNDVAPQVSLPELKREKRSQYGGSAYGGQAQYAPAPQHAPAHEYGAPQVAQMPQFVPVSSFGGPSQYGGQPSSGMHGMQFGFAPMMSPCAAAAASAPIPAIAPASFMAPHASFSAHGYGYAAPQPHYREDMADEFEVDMMSDHMPMARYAYGGAPAGHMGGGIGPMMAPVSSPTGPAIGLFPNSNIGGCGVPLLLTCSPNIVQGKIVSQPAQPQQHYSYGGASSSLGMPPAGLGIAPGAGLNLSPASLGALSGVSGANSYREVDEPTHKIQEEHLEHAPTHDHATSHEKQSTVHQ